MSQCVEQVSPESLTKHETKCWCQSRRSGKNAAEGQKFESKQDRAMADTDVSWGISSRGTFPMNQESLIWFTTKHIWLFFWLMAQPLFYAATLPTPEKSHMSLYHTCQQRQATPVRFFWNDKVNMEGYRRRMQRGRGAALLNIEFASSSVGREANEASEAGLSNVVLNNKGGRTNERERRSS